MQSRVIGPCTLYLGDCIEVMKTLEPRSIDAVVTDPPYAIPTNVAQGREVTRNVGDLSLIEDVFRRLFERFDALVDKGRWFVFADAVSYPVLFRAAYGRFSNALLVWAKSRIGMGREFRKSHELILHCWQPETPIHKDGVGRPDVLQVPPVSTKSRKHPAEKPVELIARLLEVTPASGVVLDPFMGSGSTGVACVRTGRKFIGVEIDENYFEIACQRIENAVAETPCNR